MLFPQAMHRGGSVDSLLSGEPHGTHTVNRGGELGGEFLVITGQSGAGQTLAAESLEDAGWFVIDNLPSDLVGDVVRMMVASPSSFAKVALVLRAAVPTKQALETLRLLRISGVKTQVLFLTARSETLVKRYAQTRRQHPLSLGGQIHGLLEAIEREVENLQEVRCASDLILNTSDLSKHDMRRQMAVFGSERELGQFQVSVISFGFKHGLPLDADLVFDCRFLPNPHWVEELREGTGRDPAVSSYVLEQPTALTFLENLEKMLVGLLPAYLAEGKTYLTIALGCTGGRHRSVAVAENVAARLQSRGLIPRLQHRDVRQ